MHFTIVCFEYFRRFYFHSIGLHHVKNWQGKNTKIIGWSRSRSLKSQAKIGGAASEFMHFTINLFLYTLTMIYHKGLAILSLGKL